MTENFDDVNHLVLNFYPDGYSIAVKLNEFPVFTSETILETARISYEETSLLDYIENEELPPMLVEMIDSSPKLSQYKIWHNGCLILEVRDKIELSIDDGSRNSNYDKVNDNPYNRSQTAAKLSSQLPVQNGTSPHIYEKNDPSGWLDTNCETKSMVYNSYSNGIEPNHRASSPSTATPNNNKATDRNFFILLKPTNLSMLYDVLNLTSKGWSAQERLQLESRIVLHNSPSLFLEPDPPSQPSELSGDLASRWSSSDPSLEVGTSGDNCSKRPFRQSLNKTRLKDIYINRAVPVNSKKPNGNGKTNSSSKNSSNNSKSRGDNSRMRDSNQRTNHEVSDQDDTNLPPELFLQQFLAAKRTTKKKLLPFGHAPRFHRYKRYSDQK